MVIDKNSWHYKVYMYSKLGRKAIADFSSLNHYLKQGRSLSEIFELDYAYQNPRDFCTYWRNVLIYPIVTLAINILVLLGVIVLVWNFPIAAVYAGAGLGGIALFVFTICVLAAGADYTVQKVKDTLNSDKSFVATAYKSYKHKICVRTEYTNHE